MQQCWTQAHYILPSAARVVIRKITLFCVGPYYNLKIVIRVETGLMLDPVSVKLTASSFA